MNITPQFLGIFSHIYGSDDAMTLSKALLVSVVGFFTVLCILTIIALFIKLTSFIFSAFTKKKAVPTPTPAAPTPTVQHPASAMRSELKLIDVDEPTAAVVMALVSHNSGIPLDRLDFKSIRALEDK